MFGGNLTIFLVLNKPQKPHLRPGALREIKF